MRKGVKVTHFIFFTLKYPGARMTAESNISLDDTELLESKTCWPEGVSCRELMSVEGKDRKQNQMEEDEGNDNEEDA